jgi:hypothetical protein
MSNVEDIEKAVESLPPAELAKFRAGSRHSMPKCLTRRSPPMRRPAGWTG